MKHRIHSHPAMERTYGIPQGHCIIDSELYAALLLKLGEWFDDTYPLKFDGKQKTDLDLPSTYRSQANLWKGKYFHAHNELVKANKGIRRLKKTIKVLNKRR